MLVWLKKLSIFLKHTYFPSNLPKLMIKKLLYLLCLLYSHTHSSPMYYFIFNTLLPNYCSFCNFILISLNFKKNFRNPRYA